MGAARTGAVLAALVGGWAMAAALIGAGPAAARGNDPGQRAVPLVVGHRGAAGYRPEHTSVGYDLAARMGRLSLSPTSS